MLGPSWRLRRIGRPALPASRSASRSSSNEGAPGASLATSALKKACRGAAAAAGPGGFRLREGGMTGSGGELRAGRVSQQDVTYPMSQGLTSTGQCWAGQGAGKASALTCRDSRAAPCSSGDLTSVMACGSTCRQRRNMPWRGKGMGWGEAGEYVGHLEVRLACPACPPHASTPVHAHLGQIADCNPQLHPISSTPQP